jgi:hypothetical protein
MKKNELNLPNQSEKWKMKGRLESLGRDWL